MSPTVRAALLCLLAGGFFAAASALGKAAQTGVPGPELHPFQITAGRFLFAFLALAPFLVMRGPAVFRTTIPIRHLQRVLLGAAGITCIFAALRWLPLADVTALARSSPLFAMLFAGWFLKERVSRGHWLAAMTGFAGVVIMTRPSGAAFEPAALLAVTAAVVTGAELVAIRALAVREPWLTVLAINSAMGTLITCAAAAFVFVVPSWQQFLCLAGVGTVMVAGQALMLRAFMVAEASIVAPFYYTTLLWSALIGVVAFGEVPGWHLYLGAALIAGGGLYVTMAGGRR